MENEKKEELINDNASANQTEENEESFVEATQEMSIQDSQTDSDVSETKEEDNYYKKELTKEEKRLGYNQRKKESAPKGIDESVLEEKMNELRQELMAEKEREYITSVSGSKEEADLIRHHLQNTIKRTGDIVEDIKTARFIANRGKYEQIAKEIPAMQNAQKFGRTMQGEMKQDSNNYTQEELALFAKFGIDPNARKISS